MFESYSCPSFYGRAILIGGSDAVEVPTITGGNGARRECFPMSVGTERHDAVSVTSFNVFHKLRGHEEGKMGDETFLRDPMIDGLIAYLDLLVSHELAHLCLPLYVFDLDHVLLRLAGKSLAKGLLFVYEHDSLYRHLYALVAPPQKRPDCENCLPPAPGSDVEEYLQHRCSPSSFCHVVAIIAGLTDRGRRSFCPAPPVSQVPSLSVDGEEEPKVPLGFNFATKRRFFCFHISS